MSISRPIDILNGVLVGNWGKCGAADIEALMHVLGWPIQQSLGLSHFFRHFRSRVAVGLFKCFCAYAKA